jgi:pyruvate/2-oxoglutarate dehydrogenase complex dihydrolipoamide acyltransferase (E2) component
MQQEKIEFPKFTVPGQTNWVKWVLVGVGGLVVVSTLLFGVALAKRNNQAPAVAATPAPVDVPLAPSATPRPAQKAAPALAAATSAETATASDDAPAAAKPALHRPRRSSHGHTRSLAKASSSTSKSSSSGKPDAIDELLKKFK